MYGKTAEKRWQKYGKFDPSQTFGYGKRTEKGWKTYGKTVENLRQNGGITQLSPFQEILRTSWFLNQYGKGTERRRKKNGRKPQIPQFTSTFTGVCLKKEPKVWQTGGISTAKRWQTGGNCPILAQPKNTGSPRYGIRTAMLLQWTHECLGYSWEPVKILRKAGSE